MSRPFLSTHMYYCVSANCKVILHAITLRHLAVATYTSRDMERNCRIPPVEHS